MIETGKETAGFLRAMGYEELANKHLGPAMAAIVAFSTDRAAEAVAIRVARIQRDRCIQGWHGQRVWLGDGLVPVYGRSQIIVRSAGEELRPQQLYAGQRERFPRLDQKLQYVWSENASLREVVLVTDGLDVDVLWDADVRTRLHIVLVDAAYATAAVAFRLMRQRLPRGSIFIDYTNGRQRSQGIAMIGPLRHYFSGAPDPGCHHRPPMNTAISLPHPGQGTTSTLAGMAVRQR